MKSIRDILLNPGRRDFEPPPYIDGLGRRPRLVYAAAVVVALAVAACVITGGSQNPSMLPPPLVAQTRSVMDALQSMQDKSSETCVEIRALRDFVLPLLPKLVISSLFE